MAAAKHRDAFLLFILCFLSFVAADSPNVKIVNAHHAPAMDSTQKNTEQMTEQPAKEETRWEATEADEAATADAATKKPDISVHVVPSAPPHPKDDFQEELVIRPLHSGDIYASFQFRVLWETDFMGGSKGKLTVSIKKTCYRVQ